MRRATPLLTALALLFASGGGCLPTPTNREELAKQVVPQDPGFARRLGFVYRDAADFFA